MDLEHLDAFATEIGTTDGVVAIGSGSHSQLGGSVIAGTREVTAPDLVVEHDPPEMIVRVDAGVRLSQLNAELAKSAQMVPLDAASDTQTVGGVLAVGFNGSRMLRYGLMRDYVLGLVYVSSEGELVHAGGQTVKNVSGFDLCRLMVGSLGTLGILAQVVLKCVPMPAASNWYVSSEPYETLFQNLYRPTTVFWDGHLTHVLLEGDPDDVAYQADRYALEPAAAPEVPRGHRTTMSIRDVAALNGEYLAEIGTGVVHFPGAAGQRRPVKNRALQQRLKDAFDPTGRLAPGREAWSL